MSHYILIHGAWEESRSWDLVTPRLRQEGHTVTAIDLPGHGENKQAISQVTMQAYIQTVVDAINALDHKVVLARLRVVQGKVHGTHQEGLSFQAMLAQDLAVHADTEGHGAGGFARDA